jgi:hypothetical protein
MWFFMPLSSRIGLSDTRALARRCTAARFATSRGATGRDAVEIGHQFAGTNQRLPFGDVQNVQKGAVWERLARQYWTQVERYSSIDRPAAQRQAVQDNHRLESPTREHRNRVFATFAHKLRVHCSERPCQNGERPGHSHSIVAGGLPEMS